MPKQEKKSDKKFRLFCFTAFCEQRPLIQKWMQYLAGQQEKCPTTGKLHWQYFCYIKTQMTLKAFIKSIPSDWNKPHVEPCLGNIQQNIDYCSKDTGVPNTFQEQGLKPHQGQRTELEEACKQVRTGGLTAVSSDVVLMKYHKHLSALATIRSSTIPHVYSKPKVIWLWGPTGSGKTRAAYAHDPCLYKQTSTDGWFDGYYDQKTICIDDFDKHTFPIRELLQILDGYKYNAKVKGGFQQLKADTIFITSHMEPSHYFPTERFSEINRRISEINYIGGVSITSPTSEQFLGSAAESKEEKK